MKITICGSTAFKEAMIDYKQKLQILNHEVFVHPDYEHLVRGEKKELLEKIKNEPAAVKKENGYIKWYYDAITSSDAILVLNFYKNGIENYIGGNTLMEIGFAHVNNKQIFLLNEVPEVSYSEEILAMYSKVLNGDLGKIS